MNKPALNLDPDKALAALCKKRFFRFVKEFWSIIIPEDPVWNWHIETLCNEAQEIVMRIIKIEAIKDKHGNIIKPGKAREDKLYDLLVNIPPGTTKSTIFSVMLPAWAWTVDPTLRIGTASYSQSLSIDFAVKSRDIIQSDQYKRWFGSDVKLKDDLNNKSHYKNTATGERYATSIGGTATGFHAHFWVVDDPLNAKDEASEATLTAANAFMNTTLPTRKVDKAVTVLMLIMQRLNENDPSGNWLAKKDKQLKHIKLPATINGDVKPVELKAKYVDGK